MSIGTYAELKTAVASWLHRTDLEAKIPDFIRLNEAYLSANVRSRSMETRTDLTCTISDGYVTLPTDMLEMRRLVLNRTDGTLRPLKYVTPDELVNDYPWNETGEPTVFTVIGNELQLARIPDAAYTLELTYVQRIPALSDSNTTNWLLTAYPNVYLYGTLFQACQFAFEEAQRDQYMQLLKDGMEAINAIDWYSGSTMTVRTS